MSGDVLIRVEGVSKKFSSKLKTSMKYGIMDIAKDFMGAPTHSDKLRQNEFWGVQDVSFEVRRGECLGLIGPNGAGKSTLLKMLNGIIMPDKGSIEINGRVGALIEVGAGFHPLLTGRENIYINGSIMGLKKKEIDQKFDSIVEFAELGDFIDTPVSYYSSGMYVRLGFAIAAHMEPDVLLIDEVLAVGDVGFRAKCFNAIYNMIQKSAVIIVSHSMPQISRVSSDIIVLNRGKSIFQGKDIPKGIDCYYFDFEIEKEIVSGSGRATIHNIELMSGGKKGVEYINYQDDLSICLDITIDSAVKNPSIIVAFINQELQKIAQCYSLLNQVEICNKGAKMRIQIDIEKVKFNSGMYCLEITINSEDYGEVLLKHFGIKNFRVRGDLMGFSPILLSGKWSVK